MNKTLTVHFSEKMYTPSQEPRSNIFPQLANSSSHHSFLFIENLSSNNNVGRESLI